MIRYDENLKTMPIGDPIIKTCKDCGYKGPWYWDNPEVTPVMLKCPQCGNGLAADYLLWKENELKGASK